MNKDARIMIVDDIPENVELIKTFLIEEGYKIITASNGEQALEQIKKEPPDLVLLDVLMPGINGFEVCRKIKFELKMDQLPVVMVTALDAREDKLKGLEAGADDFLSKPIDWAELIGRVRSLLRLKNAYDRLNLQLGRLNYQLGLARRVQQGLNKNVMPPALAGEIYYQPADAIGGDLVDIIALTGNKYGIFLADSSGHGVPAALVMVMVKLYFNNIIKENHNIGPASLLAEINILLNNQFGDDLDDLYVTAIFLTVDLDKKEIKWANGGHTFPLIIKDDYHWEQLESKGIPVGIYQKAKYHEMTIKYEKNYHLLLYTDGLTDLLTDGEYILSPDILTDIVPLLLEKGRKGKSKFYNKLNDKRAQNNKNGKIDDICYALVNL